MDADRYIVFEFDPGRAAEGNPRYRTRGSSRGAEAPVAKVEVAELTPEEVTDARRKPGVVAARPMPMSLVRPVSTVAVPKPSSGGVEWGVEAVGADVSPYTGDGIKVAVLDTGIDANHEAFQGATVTEQDFTGEGNGDQVGHGTHCAGTIAGRDVNGHRIGVAPGVSEILAGKVLGEQGGSTESLLKGMQWALDEGASVISMSLGIDFPGYVAYLVDNRGLPVQQATSMALEEYRSTLQLFGSLAAFIRANTTIGRTAIVVAATGNESERAANPPYTIAIAPPAGVRWLHRGRRGRSRGRRLAQRGLLLEHGSGHRGPWRRHPVGQAGRRLPDDERHEHGHAARGWRRGAVGRKSPLLERPARCPGAHLAAARERPLPVGSRAE